MVGVFPVLRQSNGTICDCTYAIIEIMSKTIVVDTCVIISALIGSTGAGREILRQCLKGEYTPLMNNALFSEYEDVSKRQTILDKCPLKSKEINDLLHSFYAVSEWISVYYLWRPNLIDEGDNFLIELALAGNATHIITNNLKDLNNAELSFPHLRILQPAQLLKGE